MIIYHVRATHILQDWSLSSYLVCEMTPVSSAGIMANTIGYVSNINRVFLTLGRIPAIITISLL